MAQPKLPVTHFAKHPRLAKAWTPETFEPEIPKVAMSKKATDNGRFFENREAPARGRFFDDMRGRDDGMFMGKTSAAVVAPGTPTPMPEGGKPTPLNIGATGAPMGGSGFRGQGMGGGMYGTGDGAKTAAPTSSPFASEDQRKPTSPVPDVSKPAGGSMFSRGMQSAMPKASPSIRGGNTNLEDPRDMGGKKNEFSAGAPKAKPRRSPGGSSGNAAAPAGSGAQGAWGALSSAMSPLRSSGNSPSAKQPATWQDLNLASNADRGPAAGGVARTAPAAKRPATWQDLNLASNADRGPAAGGGGVAASRAQQISSDDYERQAANRQLRSQGKPNRRARPSDARRESSGAQIAGGMRPMPAKNTDAGGRGRMSMSQFEARERERKNADGAAARASSMASNLSFGTGTGKRASVMDLLKVSAAAPSDGEAASDMPTGFHRPAHTQPEALESGGERFHSTEGGVIEGSRNNQRHGLVEGGAMSMPATASPALGKHASVGRFMGTSFGIEKGAGVEDWVSQRAGEFGGSLRNAIDTSTKSITQSPIAATVAALLAARIGARGVMKAGRFGKRLIKGTPPPPPPPEGFINKLVSGARTFAFGAKNLVEK